MRNPHGLSSDSHSPAETESLRLQPMEAVISASKEITPVLPSFWLPSLHPPPLARSLHQGVAFSGSARILGKAVLVSQLRVALQTSQSPSPKPGRAQGHSQDEPVCMGGGGGAWEHALKASNLFIFTLCEAIALP